MPVQICRQKFCKVYGNVLQTAPARRPLPLSHCHLFFRYLSRGEKYPPDRSEMGSAPFKVLVIKQKTARRTKGYLMKCFTSRYISLKGKYRTAKLRKKSDISALSGPKMFGVIPILCRLGNRCFTIHFWSSHLTVPYQSVADRPFPGYFPFKEKYPPEGAKNTP